MKNQNIPAVTLQRAQFLISKFRSLQEQDTNTEKNLDFITSSYLSGEGNKLLRQAVIYCICHEIKPVARCTQFAVSDALKSTIVQSLMF